MDATLLLHNTSKLKRPNPSANHNPIHDPLNSLLQSFLQTSLPSSIHLSFDSIIESSLDKADVINRALLLGSAITEAANRSARRLASAHNSVSWALPTDLTIKVFAYLDTQSVCQVAATCTLFRKCAADPLCYSFIDLTSPVHKVNNLVVSSLIQRAGNLLKSLKLGIIPVPIVPSKCRKIYYGNGSVLLEMTTDDRKNKPRKDCSNVLTRSCLTPLSSDGGVTGALLRQLQLFNIERLDDVSLGPAISACPLLLDLVIVGLPVELGQTLELVSTSCPLIERLFFQSSNTGRDDSLKMSTCEDFVTNCPHLFSLALRGFKLPDYKIHILVKGFRKLRRVDFSTSYSITGEFLRNLGNGFGGGLLEILFLRDCMHLREAEVSRFLSSVHAGRFKHLRHLDVSNREGLASDVDWNSRCLTPNFVCLDELLAGRPNLNVVAEFPAEGSFVEEATISLVEEVMISKYETPSLTSSRDGYGVSSMSEGSYNSDQSSGSEENPAFIHLNREASSDEMGYL